MGPEEREGGRERGRVEGKQVLTLLSLGLSYGRQSSRSQMTIFPLNPSRLNVSAHSTDAGPTHTQHTLTHTTHNDTYIHNTHTTHY